MSDAPPSRNPKRQRQKEGAQARRAAQVAALRRQQRNRRFIRIGMILLVSLGAVLLISALGGGDDDDPVATEDTTSTSATDDGATTTTAVPIPATPLTCAPPTGENTDLTTKPTAPVPPEPVTELACADLVVGEGDEVLNSNDTVEVQYVGVSQSTGEEFDSSWDRGETASFNLQSVIPGWTQGIPGMKVGGRRVLTIPADLAYGEDPSSGRPTGTLVFVIDLLAVNPDA